MKFDPIILKKKQNDVEAALQMGVPSCVRMMLWDRMLNLTELTNANFGLFEGTIRGGGGKAILPFIILIFCSSC